PPRAAQQQKPHFRHLLTETARRQGVDLAPETNKAVERCPTACSVRRSGGGGEAPASDAAAREGEGRAASCEDEIGGDCGLSRTIEGLFQASILRRDVAAQNPSEPGRTALWLIFLAGFAGIGLAVARQQRKSVVMER